MHSREGADGRAYCVLALCDADLLGESLQERDFVLDLKANAAFYKGRKVSAAEAVRLVRKAVADENASLNVVGRKSVNALAAAGVKGFKAKMIAGVPHVQVFHL
ncbi:MAG: DUF424 family protein [Candidatus Micrarchaeia archaeon]